MNIRNVILIFVLLLLAFAPVPAQLIRNGGDRLADPQPGKAMRYSNPLVIENAGRLADPTVIKFQDGTLPMLSITTPGPGGRRPKMTMSPG